MKTHEHALKIVLEKIRENIEREYCQHTIVFADPEQGRALLDSTIRELRSDPSLSNRLLPVQVETQGCNSIDAFWSTTLSGLKRAMRHAGLKPRLKISREGKNAKDAKDAKNAKNTKIAVLRTADHLRRQLVLMGESAQTLFESDRIDQDFGWKLRNTLQTNPRVMMLCTATHDFEAADITRQQLLSLFHVVDMRPRP